ncbi:MAG: hypothetical protein V4661_03100, partial [Pseudomonadota bacterium]
MADYYPLIARAIAGLDPSAPGESRRALYERARTALIAQLRGVQPALSEAEITRERLALEDAVRRVEADAARRAAAHEASRPEAPRAPRPDAAPAGRQTPLSPSSSSPPSSSSSPTRSPPPRRDGPRPGDALRESARAPRGPASPPSGSDRPPGGRPESGFADPPRPDAFARSSDPRSSEP